MTTKFRSDGAELIARVSGTVDRELDRLLPREDEVPAEIHRAMRYSVFPGGKRLRPALALLVAETLGIPERVALPSACALELIHAFSLIHDDLPAMDDDDLRRGRPTSHCVFGEAVAILAGDALSTLAFEVVARETPDKGTVSELVVELARASGTKGMIGGQMLDLLAEGRTPEQGLVDEIHLKKTAALLRAAAVMPAIAGRAPEETRRALTRFGELVGWAFQIVDDVLDETSSPEALGKGAHKDRERGKMTYPAAIGLPACNAKARELAAEAALQVSGLDRLGYLATLAGFVVERTS
jgi:geranylgeranyl diphosphate synthase, type II